MKGCTLLRLAILLLLLDLKAFALLGQETTFSHFKIHDGLPSGYVTEIIEDQYGFIWIGTNGGLSRFDGYSFTNYRPSPRDTTLISDEFISVIKELDKNTLLVGNKFNLEIFDQASETFHSIQIQETLPSMDFIVDILCYEGLETSGCSLQKAYIIFRLRTFIKTQLKHVISTLGIVSVLQELHTGV